MGAIRKTLSYGHASVIAGSKRLYEGMSWCLEKRKAVAAGRYGERGYLLIGNALIQTATSVILANFIIASEMANGIRCVFYALMLKISETARY